MKIVAIAALVMMAGCAQASAANHVMIFGNGTRPCSDWSDDRRDPTSATTIALEAWLGGFVTAYNTYGPGHSGDVLDGMSADAVWSWMDSYCRANPRDQLAVAAVALIDDRKASGRRR
jgi:hypothetical protein